MTSSSPIGLEGSDLSSINTMMSAVMSVGKVAENGGSPQSVKSPTKPPGPNRIGRRNQETKEEKSSYNCPLCEKVCTTQHQLTMHIRQHNTDTGGADHSCSICGKSLSSASSLDRHMLVHSGERPYKCTVCGQSFTTNGNMHSRPAAPRGPPQHLGQESRGLPSGGSGAQAEAGPVQPGRPPPSLLCLVLTRPGPPFLHQPPMTQLRAVSSPWGCRLSKTPAET